MPNLPKEFIERVQVDLGKESDDFFASLKTTPPVSIRFHPHKRTDHIHNTTAIPWCDLGYYLEERISFTSDPAFHAGSFYVQEASSMFLEKVIKQWIPDFKDLNVLDLCAAPGGKSTHLLSLMDGNGLLVSNEVTPARNAILRHNISKWGYSNVVVTQSRPESFTSLGTLFDVMVIDAPCSGEGLFRKDMAAIDEWSVKNTLLCSARQNHILSNVTNSLKKSGILIYSTCTFNPQENDDVIQGLINTGQFESLKIPKVHDGIVETKHGLQFYPHKIKGEGFYIAALIKTDDQGIKPARRKQNKILSLSDQVKQWIGVPDGHRLYQNDNRQYVFPELLAAQFDLLKEHLHIKQAGLCVGETKGKDLIPSPELALSLSLGDNISKVDLNYDEAMEFLRCNNSGMSLPLGWHLATYMNMGLGWLKSVQGRNNNYFPKSWRILNK